LTKPSAAPLNTKIPIIVRVLYRPEEH